SSLAALGEGATEDQVRDVIIYNIYKNWGDSFTRPQKSVVDKFIKTLYRSLRKDKSLLTGVANIPEGTFSALDLRAIEYFRRSDSMYLGKFITDPDLKKKITSYIKENYLEGTIPIGRNAEGIAKFKKEFGDLLQGQDWKIRMIIDTTVNKMRNTAA